MRLLYIGLIIALASIAAFFALPGTFANITYQFTSQTASFGGNDLNTVSGTFYGTKEPTLSTSPEYKQTASVFTESRTTQSSTMRTRIMKDLKSIDKMDLKGKLTAGSGTVAPGEDPTACRAYVAVEVVRSSCHLPSPQVCTGLQPPYRIDNDKEDGDGEIAVLSLEQLALGGVQSSITDVTFEKSGALWSLKSADGRSQSIDATSLGEGDYSVDIVTRATAYNANCASTADATLQSLTSTAGASAELTGSTSGSVLGEVNDVITSIKTSMTGTDSTPIKQFTGTPNFYISIAGLLLSAAGLVFKR